MGHTPLEDPKPVCQAQALIYAWARRKINQHLFTSTPLDRPVLLRETTKLKSSLTTLLSAPTTVEPLIEGYKDVNVKALRELGDILIAGLHVDTIPATYTSEPLYGKPHL
jgi:hypothetical protein